MMTASNEQTCAGHYNLYAPVAFTRHYAPNLAVPMNGITSLWIDSRITVSQDHLRRISVRKQIRQVLP
jgi:hypothetical protein